MDYIYTIQKHPRLKKKFAIFSWKNKELLDDKQGLGFTSFEKALKAAKIKYDRPQP